MRRLLPLSPTRMLRHRPHRMKTVRHALFVFFSFAFCSHPLDAQQLPIFLWPDGAPGSQGKSADEKVRLSPAGDHIVSSVHHPSITPYIPLSKNSTGAAVILIPGGGHAELWMDHEGYNVAEWLSQHGVAALVLKYRLAHEAGSTYTVEGDSLKDLQRAIRVVRNHAAQWGIDANRIGVMGFSAGGELAALAATRFDLGNSSADDPIDRQSSRPVFQALVYPAIPKDLRLSKETPPAFLLCGENDRPDISLGLPELFLAMKRADIPAEIHVYAGIGHGFGLRSTNTGPVAEWPSRFLEWLNARGFLNRN
jgi:acetyl esterase/lipase